MTTNLPTNYPALLGEIKQRIRAAQYEALKAVNKELIALYWDIGRLIIERQTGETWGRSVVGNLANDLQKEFPGISGFSVSNLWRMRLFYAAYAGKEKLAPMVREISWTKNVLAIKIETNTYENTLLNQTNFDQTVSEEIRNQAKLAVKDEYTFDFLELGEEYSERELERALISKVEIFLRESNKPIGVASYRILNTLPQELRGILPSPEQIAQLLEGV